MRFGYCANLNFLLREDEQSKAVFEAVLEVRYDYIELPLSMIPQLDAGHRRDLKKRLADADVPCRANFLLFPHELPLVGPDRDLAAIREHAKKVLPVAAELGSEVVVFGNGGSRRVREGMDTAWVHRQLVDILQVIEPIAAQNNVKIALEPLCSRETNSVTNYPEAARMAHEGGDAIGAVCDLYHVVTDGQSPAEVQQFPEKLFHCHIAYPKGRTVPTRSDDMVYYNEFANALKAAGYNERLSIEAAPPAVNLKQMVADALTLLKQLFN